MVSNPTAPKLFFQALTLTPATFEECPFEGKHSSYITLLLQGTSSVNSCYALMRRFCEGLHHFLR